MCNLIAAPSVTFPCLHILVRNASYHDYRIPASGRRWVGRAVGVALCQNVEPEDEPVQETAEHLYEEKQGDGSSQGLSPAVQITTRLK